MPSFPRTSLASLLCVLAALLISLPGRAPARIIVEVSPVYRYTTGGEFKMGMVSYNPFALGALRRGDKIVFTLQSAGNRRYALELMPASQLDKRMHDLSTFKLPWNQKPLQPVALAPQELTIPADGTYAALLISDGWWLGLDTVQVGYAVTGPLNAAEQQGVRDQFGMLANMVDAMFVVDPFTIRVGACGEVNARANLANGDITYCSEMLSAVGQSREVRDGIFFHELGHSLLAKWGLPGAAEEDMADQFAIYMLLQFQGGPGAGRALGKYFQDNCNPWLEAGGIINYGDTHTICTQRARNINAWLDDPERFTGAWNSIIYPHMQSATLRQIATAPRPYQSMEIARAVLAGRPN